MSVLEPTERTRLRRRANRAHYEREVIDAILDEALICHVGFSVNGQPFVLPTIHARIGDRLYVHGSVSARMLKVLGSGAPACVTATLLDGLVLARAGFHHTMNYRSVVLFGTAEQVSDHAEKRAALDAIVDHVVRGRSAAVRAPTAAELQATAVLRLPISEASAKIRTGFSVESEEDLAWPCWAGVLPLRLVASVPLPDPHLAPGIAVPPELAHYERAALG
mgnify:CR=1 FL=1